jgi:hypothetical protein
VAYIELKQIAISCINNYNTDLLFSVIILYEKIGILTTNIPTSQTEGIHETTGLCLSHLHSLLLIGLEKGISDINWQIICSMKKCEPFRYREK